MFQSNGQRHKLGDVRKLGRRTWHLGLGDTDAFSTMRGSTGFKAIPGEKAYVVYYAGKLNEQRYRIVGNWEIRAERRWIDGEKWELPGNSGTWTAEAT